jgi:simple sugar transport system permease protein
VSVAQVSPTASAPIVLEKTVVKSWKAPIAFGIFALVGVVAFGIFGRPGTTHFRLSTSSDFIQIPDLHLPSQLTCWILAILLVALAAYAAWRVRVAAKVPLWLTIVFVFVFMVAFLTWAAAQTNPNGPLIPVPGLLIGAVSLSVPLIFGALSGVISERSGVINIAIEGQLLAGAFVAAVVASATRQPLAGLVAAMVAGVLVSFVLAAFAIKYIVDQIIVGVVLNVLVGGLTGFLFSQVLTHNEALLNKPPRFTPIDLPILGQIPVIGPVLFNQTIVVYIMYLTVAAVAYALFRTRWGLRTRAVGEHPQAADTVGIKVNLRRFWNVSLAGAIAGFGGAYFTLVSVGSFTKDMTAGAGFIALAAVIFGRWDPIRATLAGLLFGFATNLQSVLGIIGSPVPSQFMLMLPYVVTIAAVAGLVGQSRAPAADGKPYIKS